MGNSVGNDERGFAACLDRGPLGGEGRNTRLPRFARNDGFMGGLGRQPLRKEKKDRKTRLPRFARNDESNIVILSAATACVLAVQSTIE
jgi:hypothetical protein